MKRNIILTIVTLALLLVGNSLTYAQGEAELEFRSSVTEAYFDDEFEVDVMLLNPGTQAVISIRGWLEYDANALEGVSVTTSDSPFTLSAPGEDEFDSSEGRVKIGRSNISGGVKESESKVATIRFKVKSKSPVTTVISAYDYQISELGHTSVNIIEQSFPVNILSDEPDSVHIKLNPNVSAGDTSPDADPVDVGGGATDLTNTDDPVDVTNTVVTPVYGLERPNGLKAKTGNGYVELKWDPVYDSTLAGYNLYYGKTSGEYTRRRSVGNVNRYRLDGLNNGEVYYFAITAYNSSNGESDYSDEVGLIVGEPLSSTSPYDGLIASVITNLPQQPQNGPLLNWFLVSAVGLSGMILFRKKQVN